MDWIEVWNFCRMLNQWLPILAAVGVSYRLTSMVLDRTRWTHERALHLMAWFTYIALGLVTTAGTAIHYDQPGQPDASGWSAVRLVATLLAVVLSIVWWPHPKRFTPIEEARQ